YWLFDLIVSHQVHKSVSKETFQVWDLKRVNGNEFTILATDRNHNKVTIQQIPFSDFPYDLATFWFFFGLRWRDAYKKFLLCKSSFVLSPVIVWQFALLATPIFPRLLCRVLFSAVIFANIRMHCVYASALCKEKAIIKIASQMLFFK
ncbi:MAG: hypothetical protein M3R50_12430, partial [Bacteroidota bacterium]|nr:hypothetical protein [Bacteroidota bacterium]